MKGDADGDITNTRLDYTRWTITKRRKNPKPLFNQIPLGAEVVADQSPQQTDDQHARETNESDRMIRMKRKIEDSGPKQRRDEQAPEAQRGGHAARPVRNAVERAFASQKKPASDQTDAGSLIGRKRPRRASPPADRADEGE